MAPLRAILFDKDGTLLDFQASWSRVYRELATELCDGDCERADAMLLGGGMDPVTGHVRGGTVLAAGNTLDIVAHWYPELSGDPRQAMVERFDRAFYANGIACSLLLPGVTETLAELAREGFAMGVGTSDGTAGSRAALARLGVTDYVPHIFGYDSVARPKPAPDMALAFAEACGVSPREVAVIGDNTHDLEMAHAAGAGAALGVLTGNGTRDQLAPLADAVLESVAALPTWLKSRR